MEDFYTFGLLLISCFGVWLGLSLADFNPIELMSKDLTGGSRRIARLESAVNNILNRQMIGTHGQDKHSSSTRFHLSPGARNF